MWFGICALKILIADLLAQRSHDVNIHTLNLTLTICLNIVSAIYQRDMRHIGPLKEIGNKRHRNHKHTQQFYSVRTWE